MWNAPKNDKVLLKDAK